MGKLVLVAVLLGGGWWAWQNDRVPLPELFAQPTPAWQAYTRFSTYLAHDQYGNARKLAARGAVRTVQVRELRGRRNTRLGIAGTALTRDEQQLSAAGEVTRISHDPLAERAASDGRSVVIEAVQRVCRDRSGCREARHEVEVCLVDQEWKICSFRESRA
jgi:hypothetical protein